MPSRQAIAELAVRRGSTGITLRPRRITIQLANDAAMRCRDLNYSALSMRR